MAFCKSCDREVGVERKSRAVWIIGFLVLGLLVPLWPVTLPILWSIALLLAVLPNKKVCGICKTGLTR